MPIMRRSIIQIVPAKNMIVSTCVPSMMFHMNRLVELVRPGLSVLGEPAQILPDPVYEIMEQVLSLPFGAPDFRVAQVL
jgi:hypothetical protein